MKAIDTNVLVRILIDDPGAEKQMQLARQVALKAKKIFISQIVQVEIVWVMESSYNIPKGQIILMLEHLISNSMFELQHESEFEFALSLYASTNIDFSDGVILAHSLSEQCILLTFDKKLSKLNGVALLA